MLHLVDWNFLADLLDQRCQLLLFHYISFQWLELQLLWISTRLFHVSLNGFLESSFHLWPQRLDTVEATGVWWNEQWRQKFFVWIKCLLVRRQVVEHDICHLLWVRQVLSNVVDELANTVSVAPVVAAIEWLAKSVANGAVKWDCHLLISLNDDFSLTSWVPTSVRSHPSVHLRLVEVDDLLTTLYHLP